MKAGKGRYKGKNGMEGRFDFNTRFEDGTNGTSPEEMLAAAHASCFSMALTHALEKAGKTPARIDTEATCTMEKKGDGWMISGMRLMTRAAVPGIDDATFQKIAMATKDNCIVSQALKAVPMQLEAKLQ